MAIVTRRPLTRPPGIVATRSYRNRMVALQTESCPPMHHGNFDTPTQQYGETRDRNVIDADEDTHGAR